MRIPTRLLLALFIFLALFAVVAPWLFTNYNLFPGLDFTQTGQIGDTIGGITAPIIGIISAILVYSAFIEQNRANQNLERLERQKMIQDQFTQLRSDTPEFIEMLSKLSNGLYHWYSEPNQVSNNILGYVRYYLLEFLFGINLIMRFTGEERKDLITRYGLLYQTRIADEFEKLEIRIEKNNSKFHPKFQEQISELVQTNSVLKEMLGL